jgi:hypothetical protein
MDGTSGETTESIVARLVAATNAHDLDALVACFSRDYVNETPAHPARGFVGRDQVRRNWGRLFAAIPDVKADLVRSVCDGTTAWTEWELHGTRRDGAEHLMRGVMIFSASEEVLTGVRFYMEPVDRTGNDIDDAIEQAAGAARGPSGKDMS